MKKGKSGNSSEVGRGRGLRIFMRVLAVVVVVAALLLLFLQFGAGPTIKSGAAKAGPAIIGTPITISNANVRVLSGLVDISGMVVGPPEGFKANVFEINSFKVDVDAGSVFSDTIVIREILIKDPVVTYELSGINSNIGAIMDKVGKAESKAKEKPAGQDGGKAGKKVIVEKFVFEGGKIRVASSALGGKGVVLPMPRIELADIGKKSGGATGVEVLSEVMKSIGAGVAGAVGNLGGAVMGAAGAVGSAAVDAAGAVGSAAVDAAGAVGTAAVKTVESVGKTAAGAVGAVGDSIGGLFGGGKKKEGEPEK